MLATTARAADMPGRWPVLEKPPAVATEFVSGWYLRGDIGYRYNRMSGIEAVIPVTSSSIDNVPTFGIGFGHKWKWVRADVTLDYGTRARARGGAAGVPDFYFGRIDAVTTLVNVYVDFGTWGGFTPYIGVGAGASRLNVNDFRSEGGGPAPAQDAWRFSWAGMAGASYQFMPSLALDVGYRYLRLGEAQSGPDLFGDRATFKDLTAHEVRVGLRLLID
jgi:opacity protein-like surface antigen